MRRRSAPIITILLGAMFTVALPADAQILKRIKRAAQNAVASEAGSQVDRMIRNAIRCAVDDPICVEKAEASGDDVIFVDDSGAVIVE